MPLYRTRLTFVLKVGKSRLTGTIRSEKVKYSIGFNLYDAKTKITKYNNETGLFGKDKNDNETYRVGMELGEIWGYVTDRLYTVDDFDADGKLKPGIAKVEGYNPNPGDILYKGLGW